MRGLFRDNYRFGYAPEYIHSPGEVRNGQMMPLGTRTFEDENAAWRKTHPCPLNNNGLGAQLYGSPWPPFLICLKVFMQQATLPPEALRVPCARFAAHVHQTLGCPQVTRLPLLAQWDILIALANEVPHPWGAQSIMAAFEEAGQRHLYALAIPALPRAPCQRH